MEDTDSPFQIGWLGGCGPHELFVPVTSQEFGDRLQKLITKEPWYDSVLQTDDRFTGWFRGDCFFLQHCWGTRRLRSALSGTIDIADGQTRVTFQISIDPLLQFLLLAGPFGFGVWLVLAFPRWNLLTMTGASVLWLIGAITWSLSSRTDSRQLLEAFLDLIRFRPRLDDSQAG